MKHLISLLSLLTLSALLHVVSAQVKGHAYYSTMMQYGDQTGIRMMLEVDNNGHLALGQIQHSYNGTPLRLYGRRDGQNPNVIRLEEHQPNGQLTGMLTVYFEKGIIKRGAWQNPGSKDTLQVQFYSSSAFPYSQIKTFFHPVTSMQEIGGHYINYYLANDAIHNDRALNIQQHANDKGFFSIEQSGATLTYGYYINKSNNEWEYTYKEGNSSVTLSAQVYEDFVDIRVIDQKGKGAKKAVQSAGFFIREQGVKEVTMPAVNDIFSIRGRLDNGVPSLLVSKKRLDAESAIFGQPERDFAQGRHNIYMVQGRVKDIFLDSSGEGFNPLLCLLLEDNTVQFMSLAMFRHHHAVCVSDPLPGVMGVEGFYIGEPIPDGTLKRQDTQWIYAQNSDGGSFSIYEAEFSGDFMLNPKNTIDCDAYLGIGENWSITIGPKGIGGAYSGVYLVTNIEEVDGREVTTIYYHLNEHRIDTDHREACDISGTFRYYHDADNYNDIHVTPVDGLEFAPEGKTVKFTYMEELG